MNMTSGTEPTLLQTIRDLRPDVARRQPLSHDAAQAAAHLADLEAELAKLDLPPGQVDELRDPAILDFLGAVLGGSRYLRMLVMQSPARLVTLLANAPDRHLAQMIDTLKGEAATSDLPTMKAWMTTLRAFKSEAALLISLADLSGHWPIMRATEALADVADAACDAACAYLFRAAQKKGDWLAAPDDPAPHRHSGLIVLAMGKHGARELNFSSDIDLIVFYEHEKARLRDGLEPAQFFIRLTRDLVKLLNDRTADGYVFRTDLRLRPDPGATQVAISTESALHYYESFGQNWERAAMIKARPAAADIEQGASFLDELSPFIWRKYLDFAAIADIHAMKRQIHAHRGFKEIAVKGHNIKLGRGGIREIEFFVQTQQLIAGGRQTDLRQPRTLATLAGLAERGWIEADVVKDLDEAYRFLRSIEHRIQMTADEQTHQVPADDDALATLAGFSGYPTTDAFSDALLEQLRTVQSHYASLFENDPELSSAASNLVLAGEDDDPETIASLEMMGFSQPAQVLSTIRAWHRGRYPAVSSEAARARLTVVQPLLVEALSQTVNPDAALAGFDRFLRQLPAGVQLFALLRAHPELMRLVALIMGSAPRLALILSRHRRVFDAVLDPRIMGTTPTHDEMRQLIEAELADAEGLEVVLDRARVIGREQIFLIGIRLLTGLIDPEEAGPAYTLIAETLIEKLHQAVQADFEARHGRVAGGRSAVVAMGRLGSREMTATSDLDLIVIYDADPEAKQSDGNRPLAVSQYFARLTQRLISAISAPTAEGKLYEVDMRLRPSGNQGPVATHLDSFETYQRQEAWTWEHMALTRARVISGPPDLRSVIEAAIATTLRMPRDPAKLAADVRDMRERIWTEKGTENTWDMKQSRGGLIDLEFIAQYLQLRHGADHPNVFEPNTLTALARLAEEGLIEVEDCQSLTGAAHLLNTLAQLLRICFEGGSEIAAAPDGLKSLLASACGEPDLTRVELKLGESQAAVRELFDKLVI
jgi:glutamate-ammonia-ligase adenylyltransferase